jgi:DNA-binding SARP family transcriptional activator/predicted ATPase
MTTGIQVSTLGKLLITRDGIALDDFVSTKAILLFVYLAMHPGPHPRKKLAAILWSETSDEQALKNLRTVLSSIRQQVNEAVIVTHDELAINSSLSVEVDASIFENSLKKAFSSPGTLDPLKTLQTLETLYQGDFIQGVAIRDAAALDEWVTEKQRHLRALYAQLLYQIAEIAQKRNQYEMGLQYAWKLVSIEPLWDAAARQLMSLLASTHRTSEALLYYERFVQLLATELEAEPEDETQALYEQIRSRSVSPVIIGGLPSVGMADIPFIEPIDDIEIAQRMLNTPHCRLLTIFGIGGLGKTALATQLAFHRQHLYQDGACFVSLTIAQSARDLLQVVAAALNIDFSASMEDEALEKILIEDLKPKHLMLVLDNYEQLLPETGFVQRLLAEAASVQVIVTSHTQLSLYREWLLPLRGLRVPEIGAPNAQQYEAIRLFELTAQRINPHFQIQTSLEDVIRICQLVDRLPLGIVIAAGWVQYMPPKEILAMMEKDLLQVEAIHHDIPARHQSFKGLLNAMLAHLSPQEQQALMCLSIFEGSFSFKAALAVADITANEFKRLTDKCLVQTIEGFRYTVHSIVRHAFKSQLEASPHLQSVAARYRTYFQQWSDDFYAQVVPLHDVMHMIDVEQHNLWQVMGLSEFERQQFILHISPAMTEYWINRGYHAKGIIPLLQTSGNNPDIAPETRIRGLIALARILERTSQYEQAWDACEQVLELEKPLNLPTIKARALRVLSEISSSRAQFAQACDYLDAIISMATHTLLEANPQLQRLVALAHEDLGEIMMSQGEYETASRYIEIAMHYWNEHGETLRETIAQSYLGIIALKKTHYRYAFQIFESILAKAKNARNQTLMTIFSTYLGKAALELGDYRLACLVSYEALQIAVQIDRRKTMIQLVEQFSQLAIHLDCSDLGGQLFGFAAAMRERLNIPISPHNQPEYRQYQQRLRDHLGDAFDRNYKIGSEASLMMIVHLTSYLHSIVQSDAKV